MLVGEILFSNKSAYLFSNPARGDIVAFNDPSFTYADNKFVAWWQRHMWGPTNWTKRIIGLPGDHVKGVQENDSLVVYVNGQILPEPYVNNYPLIGVWHRGVEPSLAQLQRDAWSYKTFDPEKTFDAQPWYALDAQSIVYAHDGAPLIRAQKVTAEKSNDDSHDSVVFDVVLHDAEYWVMGDNRANSHDSREFGPLAQHNIHGKIIYRLFSVDHHGDWMLFDFLCHPITFYKSIRWHRCLEKIL